MYCWVCCFIKYFLLIDVKHDNEIASSFQINSLSLQKEIIIIYSHSTLSLGGTHLSHFMSLKYRAEIFPFNTFCMGEMVGDITYEIG